MALSRRCIAAAAAVGAAATSAHRLKAAAVRVASLIMSSCGMPAGVSGGSESRADGSVSAYLILSPSRPQRLARQHVSLSSC